MTTSTRIWEQKRTDETRMVEEKLRQHFEIVDAYRYNSASIRLRVIDPRFESIAQEDRDAIVEPHLDLLPERTQGDITTLFTFAPSELQGSASNLRVLFFNSEFEDPSPSQL